MLIFQNCWCLLVSSAQRMLGLVWGCGLSGSWQTQLRPPQNQDADSKSAHKHTLSCSFISHTLGTVNVTHTHTYTQAEILLISFKREWPRLDGNKGGGFTSRMGWGSTLVDLCTVYLHWKPRRCESPALRRYTNMGAICRGGFNSLQSNDWLLSHRPLQELSQWILSASYGSPPHQITLTQTTHPLNKYDWCIFSAG